MGEDNHNLIHYQAGIWNGEGINTKLSEERKHADGNFDYIGTIQFQPIKNLYVGLFGWTGSGIDKAGNVQNRDKYAFGVKYENKGWSFRSEWGHAKYSGNVQDDAWYVVGGMPINSWFKLCAQYQTYRSNESWRTAQCVYSLIPEIQLHKNLKFQIQYNFNDNRGAADKHFNEIWAETYFRF